MAEADGCASRKDGAEYRRARVDVEMQAALGEYFAARFRAAVLLYVYEVSREEAALEAAIEQYRKARAAYASGAQAAKGAYAGDITFGEQPYLRGHWLDRLPAIDKDIAALAAKLSGERREASTGVAAIIQSVLEPHGRPAIGILHEPPASFGHGEELQLSLHAPDGLSEVRLHYRRVNQAENFVPVAMERHESRFEGAIPADYTRARFPLEYYFAIRKSDGSAALYPGFAPGLTNQPYFVVQGSRTANYDGKPSLGG